MMKRLTDSKIAADLKSNYEGLQKAGIEPSPDHLIYVRLAEYEDKEELKRQLLMEAVDGFKALGKELDEKCELNLDCSKCPLNSGGNCRSWKHSKAVMKLIGGK